MENDFSRDPNDYRLSRHGMQRRREREIEPEDIATTIQNGEEVDRITDPDHGNYGIRLRNVYLGREHIVCIVPPAWNDGDSKGTVKTAWHEGHVEREIA